MLSGGLWKVILSNSTRLFSDCVLRRLISARGYETFWSMAAQSAPLSKECETLWPLDAQEACLGQRV